MEVSTTLIRISMPPIVGVPFFFRCSLGPSSLTVCPTFSRRRKGITSFLKISFLIWKSECIIDRSGSGGCRLLAETTLMGRVFLQ